MIAKTPWNIILPVILSIFLGFFAILVFHKYFFGKNIINTNANNCVCDSNEKYTIYPNIKYCDCILLKINNKYVYYSVKDVCNNSNLLNLIEECYYNYEVIKCGGVPKEFYIKYMECINNCCKK